MIGGRGGDVLLAIGALVGVAAAAAGIAGPRADQGSAMPAGAVALVNGTQVTAAQYHRSVAAIAKDRRDGGNAVLRRRALDRLIDEELLVQRGIELGLPTRDLRVRNNLTAAVIDLIVARAEQSYNPPDEHTLRAFHVGNSYYFQAAARTHVAELYYAGPDAQSRAQRATARARSGTSHSDLAKQADPPPLALPDGALPTAKLRDYLGPSAARAAAALAIDAISDPIRAASGFYVLRVIARRAGHTRPFHTVRKLVEAEHRRRAGDAALTRFLERRRARSRITIAEGRL